MEILITLIVLFVCIITHSIASRLPVLKNNNSVVLFIMIGSIFGLIYAALLYIMQGLTLCLLSNLLVYAFGCELYIFIFTMTIGSISANLLLRLRNHNLTIEEINRLYNSKKMVSDRIQRLISVELIAESDAGLFLSSKGERLARAFAWFRSFFRHPM